MNRVGTYQVHKHRQEVLGDLVQARTRASAPLRQHRDVLDDAVEFLKRFS